MYIYSSLYILNTWQKARAIGYPFSFEILLSSTPDARSYTLTAQSIHPTAIYMYVCMYIYVCVCNMQGHWRVM